MNSKDDIRPISYVKTKAAFLNCFPVIYCFARINLCPPFSEVVYCTTVINLTTGGKS